MIRLRVFFHRLRGMIFKRRFERDMDEEIRSHLVMQIEENVLQGMSREEARQAALRKFGGVEKVKEAYRDRIGLPLVESTLQDLRYGARILRKNPGFTLAAALTLALGIGSNTAIFSVVNVVLLKPAPYYDPQRLVWVTMAVNGNDAGGATARSYLGWKAESKAFEHLVAFGGEPINWTGRGRPQRLSSAWVTATMFPALGVAPLLGRAFTPEEDRPQGERVALLSHALWVRSFGGDPAVIGQSLTLGDRSWKVIGIMPPGFRFLQDGRFLGEIDVWLPLALDAERELKGEGSIIINVVGRLKPGLSVEQARAELSLMLQQIYPKAPPGVVQAKVKPLSEMLVGNLRRGALTLFGAVVFLLLIACANVANLLLGRAAMRQKEMAVRAAIGAGRGRLVRQMLTESLLLSMFGGALGLLLAALGVKALVAGVPDDLAHLRLSSVDGATLGFTFLASLVTGIAAGVIPALQTSQTDLCEALKEGARKTAPLRRRGLGRISPALVIGELALTLVLLVGAGLLIKSFLRLLSVEPGYDPKNLLTMMIPLDDVRYTPGSPQVKAFYREALTRVVTIPGVKAAATVSGLPLTGRPVGRGVTIEGRPPMPGWQQPLVESSEVSPDYFRAMGMRLRAGRGFTEQDNENAPRVIVINETLARQFFSVEDPIGKRLLYGSLQSQLAHTIVGVATDVKRYGLEVEVLPEIYEPYLQNPQLPGFITLAVRTAGNPLDRADAVRQQIWTIEADQPIINVKTMEERLADSVAPRRFQMLLFGAFAFVALALAAVGVYGVISHSVSRRAHEIGIRIAIGARPRDVLTMVIMQGVSLALIGVAIGLAAALALTRVMSGLLFNVKATDPATFAGISLLLVGVAFLAAYLSARRATKVDPMVALRSE